MKAHSPEHIAEYYDQTLNHYQHWWKLDDALAVHYGMWDNNTRSFLEALENTNRKLMEMADVDREARVLDAGCGVGGSAFYLAREKQARVTGITLSRKQLDYANAKRDESPLAELVDFKLEDYTRTSFADHSFDLVWAIESVTSSPDKQSFAREALRLLKPGGRLIIADYFQVDENPNDPAGWLNKWQDCWTLAPFMTVKAYAGVFESTGFRLVRDEDVTENIIPTARYMYRAYLLGALPSVLYNLFHNTSRYAKSHYKSGKYQYRALKAGLWEYRILLFEKPGGSARGQS